MFKIGQKVVCINDAHQMHTIPPSPDVVKGKIYTVRGIRHGTGGLYLEGMFLDMIAPGIERGYLRERFRPLDERFAEEVLEKIMLESKAEEMHQEMKV